MRFLEDLWDAVVEVEDLRQVGGWNMGIGKSNRLEILYGYQGDDPSISTCNE